MEISAAMRSHRVAAAAGIVLSRSEVVGVSWHRPFEAPFETQGKQGGQESLCYRVVAHF
jgi:hypothetical protein